jgi:hypothetical protein
MCDTSHTRNNLLALHVEVLAGAVVALLVVASEAAKGCCKLFEVSTLHVQFNWKFLARQHFRVAADTVVCLLSRVVLNESITMHMLRQQAEQCLQVLLLL